MKQALKELEAIKRLLILQLVTSGILRSEIAKVLGVSVKEIPHAR